MVQSRSPAPCPDASWKSPTLGKIHHLPGVIISRADCSHYDKCSFAVQQNLPGSNLYLLLIPCERVVSSFVVPSDENSHKHSFLKAEQAWSLFASPGPCGCFPGLFQSPADAPALPHPTGWALCQVFWGLTFVLFQQRQIFEETPLSLWDVVLWFVCLYCYC